MTPKQILDSFSETLMRDERILSAQERALVATLLHHAKAATSENPDMQDSVRKVIASAVGETVAQRAFAVLGTSIVERILENSSLPLGDSAGARTADSYTGPRPPSSPNDPQTPTDSLPGVRTGMHSKPSPPFDPQPPSASISTEGARTADMHSGPRPPSSPHDPQSPGEFLRTTGVRSADINASPRPPQGPQTPGESLPTVGVRTADMFAGPHPPVQPQHPGESLPTVETRTARMSSSPHPPSQPDPPSEFMPTVVARSANVYSPRPPISPGPQTPGESRRATMTEPDPPATTPKGPQPPGVRAPQKEPHKPHPSPKEPQSPGHARAEVVSDTATAVAEMPPVLPAQCVVLDEFLAPQELEELTRFALEHESDFKASEVVAPHADSGVVNYEHRRSRVLMDLAQHQDVMVERIKSVLPRVLDELGMEPFTIAGVEVQATASNDGDFFHFHSDNGSDRVASRYLTFVYFFHREPRQFEGGELRIHDSSRQDGLYVSDGSYQTIVPRQNQIIFFPCELLHEITPVNCASQQFADSRFTVNGWLRR
jgi:Rps23 Pro-64 3,4-dihydroxylase Tpa1-like proline 4-hydroxylase